MKEFEMRRDMGILEIFSVTLRHLSGTQREGERGNCMQ